MNTHIREYAASIGALPMPDGDAITRYELAVERYAATGDAQALREGLLALGVDAMTVRWHVANRGLHLSCLCGDEVTS